MEDINLYYAEQDPIKRKEILLAMLEKHPSDPDWEKRAEMYERRFAKIKKDGNKDDYLYSWMMLMSGGYQKSAFFKAGIKRDARQALEMLGLFDEKPDAVTKREIYDMAYKYISITINSGTYGRVFGLVKISDKSATRKLCTDIYTGSVYGVGLVGKKWASDILLDLFRQAFCACVEGGEEIWNDFFGDYPDNE